MDQNRNLQLTTMGKETAERIYEKHSVLSELLIGIGVSQETAQMDNSEIYLYEAALLYRRCFCVQATQRK